MKRTAIILNLHLFLLCTIFGQSSYERSWQECQKLGYYESQQCMIGSETPWFEGTTISDRVINRVTVKDKVAVIHFWYMACPPCIAELGGLNDVVKAYQERSDIEFISFTRDDKEDLVESFFPNHALLFEIIPDSEKSILDVFKIWWGFPTTMVIDKTGKIRLITSGGKPDADEASREIKETLIKAIEECLKE